MDLVIVTPGATDSLPGTCVGQAGLPLSDRGFTAIQSLAASWCGPPPRFLFASNLPRAQQSAQVFAAHFASEPLLEARLRAQHMGAWEGWAWDDVANDDSERYRNWRRNPAIHAATDGETFASVLQRSGAWLVSVLDGTEAHDTVMAVTHASILRALLCHALGLPPAGGHRLAAVSARASLIRCRDDRFEVCYLNASSFQVPPCPSPHTTKTTP